MVRYLKSYDDFDLLKVLVHDRLLMDIIVSVDIDYVVHNDHWSLVLIFALLVCFALLAWWYVLIVYFIDHLIERGESVMFIFFLSL